MRPAIRAVRLSKHYGSYWNPRSLLRQILTGKDSAQRIRALEGVGFEVEAGRALGVVGRNGSGKTTLLKLVSGAAHPSSGRVEVDGRIGALLDLGAGFHPEFSGRENIRFTGALMGLEPDRVREAEDRIVAFSELEEFIDQPVRTYSAGMYVRLGFAVSTGFHPSVLVIDEALAVGDQPFQKKCTDRILSIKKRGAAIVICSHNLYQVRTLCEEAIWLREGRPRSQGDAVTVVEDYSRFLGQAAAPRVAGAGAPGPGPAIGGEDHHGKAGQQHGGDHLGDVPAAGEHDLDAGPDDENHEQARQDGQRIGRRDVGGPEGRRAHLRVLQEAPRRADRGEPGTARRMPRIVDVGRIVSPQAVGERRGRIQGAGRHRRQIGERRDRVAGPLRVGRGRQENQGARQCRGGAGHRGRMGPGTPVEANDGATRRERAARGTGLPGRRWQVWSRRWR